MAHEKIVTLFDTVQQAKDARRELEAAGFANHDISIISGEDLQSEGKAIRHPSLWQRLFGTGVDKENAELYTQALDTGGVILTLRAKEDDVPQALAILDASSAAAGAGADYAGGQTPAMLATLRATRQHLPLAGLRPVLTRQTMRMRRYYP